MEPEIFSDSNRPFFQYNGSSDYFYCLPWNYEKPSNNTHKYPLVVYLHGAEGSGNIASLNYLGYDTDDGNDDQVAKNFQAGFPSFILVPQSYGDVWEPSKVVSEIEEFKSKYRIDASRIYLIGYSMGGSGSYIVANSWYDTNKNLFAGIVRLAGQSQTVVRDEIAQKTPVWLHIGLKDTQLRIDITREAYDFLKTKHPAAVDSVLTESVNGVESSTAILKENNLEIARKTEYRNLGHDIDLIPFENSTVIKWLFEQNLQNRTSK